MSVDADPVPVLESPAGPGQPEEPLPADRYQDRELSWLQFNGRVLQLSENPQLPVLDRAKFLAIFASNLDEYFMVRVAGLKRRLATGITVKSASGRPATEIVAQIRQRTPRRAAGATLVQAAPDLVHRTNFGQHTPQFGGDGGAVFGELEIQAGSSSNASMRLGWCLGRPKTATSRASSVSASGTAASCNNARLAGSKAAGSGPTARSRASTAGRSKPPPRSGRSAKKR